MKRVLFLSLCLVPFSGLAQSLSTVAPNNGTGGVFMNLTDLSGVGLLITEFDVPFGGTAATARTVEIYTRPGTYAGFTTSSVGWTLHETTATVSGATTSTWVPINMANDISIAASQTLAVYLHCTSASGSGIRYTGTGTGGHQTLFSDANIQLFSDISRTGAVPFGGSQFTPRTFSGTVHYSPVPEPGTVIAVLAGIAMLALRRRK